MTAPFPIEVESPSGDQFSIDLRRAGLVDDDVEVYNLPFWLWHFVRFRGAYYVTVVRRMKGSEYLRLRNDAFQWRSAAPSKRTIAEREARSAAAAIAAGQWPEREDDYVRRM